MLKKPHRLPPLPQRQTSALTRYLTDKHQCRAVAFRKLGRQSVRDFLEHHLPIVRFEAETGSMYVGEQRYLAIRTPRP